MEAVLTLPSPSSRLNHYLTAAEISARRDRIHQVLPDLYQRLSPCTLCPRRCGAPRTQGETGECGLTSRLRVASVARHFGEEPPVSGQLGAINVFFSGCNLHCRHCQNWPLSQQQVGQDIKVEDLADRILKKWRGGAHTLGWVTPTAQLPLALETYQLCLQQGCDLPLVHNGGGYEDPEIIAWLAGIVDLWLPDAKTADGERGWQINRVPDYPGVNLLALAAMVHQVQTGSARAIIIRHLILPGANSDSRQVLRRLWKSFGNSLHLSLLSQYFPTYQTLGTETLGRPITESEYKSIVQYARHLGFQHGWVQPKEEVYGIPLHCLS